MRDSEREERERRKRKSQYISLRKLILYDNQLLCLEVNQQKIIDFYNTQTHLHTHTNTPFTTNT